MKRQYIMLCAIGLLAAQGCKKYLDVTPYGQPLVENFYKTEDDAKLAMTAAYSPLRESISNEDFAKGQTNDLFLGDIGTDDILKGGGSSSDGPALVQKETYQLTSDNANITLKWKIDFKGIYFSNLILEKIPSIPFAAADAALKDRFLGEAYFLRAYYYFDLVKYFGDVPFIDHVLENGEYNLPRSPKAKIYELIESDLNNAISKMPTRFTYAKSDVGHADKGAALGLMVKVCAFENKMDKVKTYAEQLFAITNYSLTPNFGDIFQPTGEWNSESIFEIDAGSFSDNRGSLMVRLTSPRTQGGVGFSQIKDGLRNEFEPNDTRYTASFYNVTGNYGTNWYDRKYSISPYSNYVKATVGGALPNGAANFRVIRLSDIYLLYAEAVYNTDPVTARLYVNKVRTRARGSQALTVVPNLDVTVTGTSLLNAIYHERRVELAGEGQRFFDLIRTGRATTILAPLGFKAGVNEVLPIPLDQIALSNGILKQNTGY